MTETMKVNLTKTSVVLKIMGVVAGGFLACGMFYSNIDSRIDKIESAQSRFEGVMDERTRNTGKRVDEIYDIVKDWRPVSGETQAKNKG